MKINTVSIYENKNKINKQNRPTTFKGGTCRIHAESISDILSTDNLIAFLASFNRLPIDAQMAIDEFDTDIFGVRLPKTFDLPTGMDVILVQAKSDELPNNYGLSHLRAEGPTYRYLNPGLIRNELSDEIVMSSLRAKTGEKNAFLPPLAQNTQLSVLI